MFLPLLSPILQLCYFSNMISVILLFAAFAQCIQAASVFEKCENDYQCLSTPILLKCISFTSTSLCVPPDYDKVLLAGSKRFYSFDDKLQREILGYYFGLEIINDDAEISYETAETNEFKKRTSRQLVVDEESASKERRLLENESPLITDDIYDEDYNEWKLLRDWDKLGDLTDGFFTDIESLAHPTFPIKNKIVESEWPKRAATESIKNEADKSSQQTRKKRNRNVHRNGRNLGYFYSSLSFSGKLYKELNKNEFPHLLSWSKDGNGVCLLLTDDEFKEKVLPLLCNGKINSLVRQMYIHGFRQRGFYDINSKMQCFRNRDERFRRRF